MEKEIKTFKITYDEKGKIFFTEIDKKTGEYTMHREGIAVETKELIDRSISDITTGSIFSNSSGTSIISFK